MAFYFLRISNNKGRVLFGFYFWHIIKEVFHKNIYGNIFDMTSVAAKMSVRIRGPTTEIPKNKPKFMKNVFFDPFHKSFSAV